MALSEEAIARLRSQLQIKEIPSPEVGGDLSISGDPELRRRTRGRMGMPANFRQEAGTALRGLERAGRLAGLGIGTALSVNPLLAGLHLVPGVKDWLPDPTKIPGGAREFLDLAREGDWDAAIEAYQDELDAGPGYWGAAEVAGSFIPTGGPAIGGAKLISAAPKLAGTLGKIAPIAARTQAARGIERGLTGAGKVLRAPWEAEEAVGRGALKGLGFAARSIRHPTTGPLSQAIARKGLADPPPPLLNVADEYRTAGFGEEVDFPEPWDTRNVYEGPQPGQTNIQRREAQERLMEDLDFLEDSRTAGFTEITQPRDPRIQAQVAREAKPIKTGREALIKRLSLEVDMGRLEPSVAIAARRWLEMLPEKYLDDLGSSYTKKAIAAPQPLKPGQEIAGTYSPGRLWPGFEGDPRRIPAIITIAIDSVNKEVKDAGQTIIHEISHHLDDFISESDVLKLFKQWQKEMFTDGMGVLEEVSRIRQVMGRKQLTQEQADLVNSAYRYEGGFKEWLAEVMTDKALRDIYMEIPSYKGVIEKALAQVKVIAKAVLEFIGGDDAERVYKKLINGDYSSVERGAMRSRRMEAEAKSFQDIVEGTVEMREVKSLEELIARGKKRAARQLGEVPPSGPSGPAATEAGEFFKGLGKRFVAPLRNLLDVSAEVKTVQNPVAKKLAELGINPSAAQNTEIGKIGIGYSRQRVAIDELSDTAVSAALDVHASRILGRMGSVLPIDNNGYFGQTGKLWNDVFENYKNPAYKLTDEQKAYIEDYTQLMLDVEEMRVAAGLKPRAKNREEGWFYVPRQVTGKRGIELEKPSNPNLVRLWEEATEAFEQKGVRYLNDPRETAMIHVRAAYKEILDKQLSDALEPFSIGAVDLVPQSIRGPAQAAVRALRAAERESRRLGVPTTPGAKMTRQQRAAKFRENALRADYVTKNKAFKTALARAKATKEDSVPGALFGQNQPEDIGIAQWRHRFFRKEDLDTLGKSLEVFDNPAGRKYAPGTVAKVFQTSGNTIRFLASVGDFAMPLIHGMLLLARNPVAWGRMAYRHTEAFFNPVVQAKLIRDNLAEYQWLARNGVPIGDPEFFAALAPGQGIPLGRVAELIGRAVGSEDYGTSVRNLLRAGGKQSFGRFQAAYNTGLGWGRVQLLKGMRSSWKGTDAELAQYLRNMTGGLDSRALGVPPDRRAAEGMWMAFSPRLLRSTIALVADAARPWTPQGREALRALATLTTGVMTFYAITGYALGKSNEEIREGMNPLNGRRFLSHNINGDWIGVGGQVRALTQFMASVISSVAPGGEPIQTLKTTDMYKNPFMRFYSSRGAPGVSIAGGLVEAGTAGLGWKNVDVLPFEQVDSLPDLGKHLFTSALPFTLQSLIEGGQWRTAGAEFVGFRGGTDPRDVKSQEIFDKEYRNVEPFMQRMIREIIEGEESQFDKIEQERREQLLELLGEVRSGQRKDSFNIWLEVRRINDRAAGARRQAGEGIEFDPADVDADDFGVRALNQRSALYDDPEVMSETGRMKYVTVGGKSVSVFSRKLAALEKTWTAEQRKFVMRNTNTRPIPIELVAVLPKEHGRSIALSQTAREKHLRDMGKPDLAKLSRRLFSINIEG